jgi:hypothetical protein
LFKTAKSAAICCDRCHKERKYFADQLKGSALLPFDPITFGEDHGELARKHGGFHGAVGELTGAVFFKCASPKLFRGVKIRRTWHANIPSVVLRPSHGRGQHGERENNAGNDDGGFCWHGYSSFFRNGAIATVRSASLRYQRDRYLALIGIK